MICKNILCSNSGKVRGRETDKPGVGMSISAVELQAAVLQYVLLLKVLRVMQLMSDGALLTVFPS